MIRPGLRREYMPTTDPRTSIRLFLLRRASKESRMSHQRAGIPPQNTSRIRHFVRPAIGLLALVQTLLFAAPAAATCTASLVLTPKGNGVVNFSLTGSGSCPNTTNNQTKVTLYIRMDDGQFAEDTDCLASPCSISSNHS